MTKLMIFNAIPFYEKVLENVILILKQSDCYGDLRYNLEKYIDDLKDHLKSLNRDKK